MLSRFRKKKTAPPGMVEELLERSFGRSWTPDVARNFAAEIARANRMGMRPGVFGKAGDSNLGAYNALYGLGCREPIWDRFGDLAPVLERYREVTLTEGREIPGQVPPAADRTPWNSFSRSSESARSGIIADQLIEPSGKFAGQAGWQPSADCDPEETALEDEVRLIKPQFVLIHLGTNGSSYGMTADQTAEQVRDVITAIRKLGPAPVAFTIPPQLDEQGHRGRGEFAKAPSAGIARIAAEEKVPLFDQWQALADDRMINNGMISFDGEHYDGFHLETLGGFRAKRALDRSVDFRPAALTYGTNLRNLLFLHVLRELDAVIRG